MKTMPQCDQAGNWDKCILLCDNFLNYFPKNYRTTEIDNLKAVMEDKRDVAELMETVKRLGNKFESAKTVLAAYLDGNPDSTQAARIRDNIARLDRNLRESREWQTAAAYSQNSQYSLPDRINYIGQYIRLNPSGRFDKSARLLLSQLLKTERFIKTALKSNADASKWYWPRKETGFRPRKGKSLLRSVSPVPDMSSMATTLSPTPRPG
jgi:hypothetical protein